MKQGNKELKKAEEHQKRGKVDDPQKGRHWWQKKPKN